MHKMAESRNHSPYEKKIKIKTKINIKTELATMRLDYKHAG